MQTSKGELTRNEIECLTDDLKPAVKGLQLIHMAFFLGSAVLVGLFYFNCKKIAGNDAPAPLLFLVLGILPVAPSFLIPVLMRAAKPTPDERSSKELASTYQSSHIVGCAMLESGIMFSSMAFIVANTIPKWFVLLPAMLLLILLVRFPLAGKLTDWVTHQLESRRN